MNRYADSSFLVSCYVTDANTAQAKAWLLRTGGPLVFTALHIVIPTTNIRGSAKRIAAFTLQLWTMLTPQQPEGCVPVVVSRCAQP